MKLIVGLGNPGSKYHNTRHNVGYMILDEFAKKHHLSFKLDTKFNGEITTLNKGSEKIIYLKPTTYMNLSGEAIIKVMKYYDIDLDDVLVFVDDINLDVGRLRLRALGGHGGHNGLRNIIGLCHSDEFKRVRVGVGLNSKLPLDHYVLSQFSKEDMITISIAIDKSIQIIEQFIDGVSFIDIMTTFNTQT
ncbi:aminoacyl-tRNA hydrolase [Tenericutes bacterium MZ-XQ]|nr:aminoacyl-tRNA hydrolase [Tenericutes bacterium MZ-XQ]